ncbi:speckle-type POZ protein B-like protein [Leptotrombidium deliense]|uniref:Speckle-type POZ protein B-like protein n=1 Tax=Leptotrombidium deliense TaxID=299467 RepID=A0A443SPL9_9ACAR|nr:speckle-type POZ protein B-like protein [Leptotrombidium deliense]
MASFQLNTTKCGKFTVKWEIKNIFDLKEKRLESSRFCCPSGKHVFRLFLWPISEREEDKDFVSLFLGYEIKHSKETKVSAKYSVSLLDRNNVKIISQDVGFHTFSVQTFLNYGMYRFLKRTNLYFINEGSLSGKVTIVADIEEAEDVISDFITEKPIEYSTHCDLESLFKNKTLTDVDINVNGVIIAAHKAILASASQMFLSQFEANRDQVCFEIQDFSENVVRKAIEFIYTSKLEDFNEICFDLLQFAFKYEVKGLHSFIESYLIDSLSLHNVIDSIAIADKTEAKTLKSLCIQLICKNSKAIATNEKLQSLDSSVAKELFSALINCN